MEYFNIFSDVCRLQQAHHNGGSPMGRERQERICIQLQPRRGLVQQRGVREVHASGRLRVGSTTFPSVVFPW